MSVRRAFVLLLALSTLTFLVACGGSGTSVTQPVAPPSGGFSNSNLSGTYVFSVSGTDVDGASFAVVGTFIANGAGGNGKGGITGGAIDINDAGFGSLSTPVAPISNAAVNNNGFYSVGIDGRGTATLGTSTPFGNITIDFVLSSSSHGLITEFDGNGSGSGTLDLQTASLTQSSIAGSYGFSFSGVDSGLSTPFATVGGFTIDSTGSITAGGEDFNDGDIPYTNQSLGGQVTLGPASTAATTLTTGSFSTLTFDVYAIDSTHLKFIEMDAGPILSGDAFSQTSATIAAGTNAFTMTGFLPFSPTAAVPFAAGGFMVTDGAGNITAASTEDENDGGAPSTSPISFTASYANTGSVIPSRFTLSNFASFVGGTEYAAYPSSGGLLLLEIDGSGIMTGAAYPQSSTTFSAAQGYGLNLTGINLTDDVEIDDIAEFTAASSGATVTGVIDENYAPSGTLLYALALSGTYAPPDSNGRGQIVAAAGNSTTSTLNGGIGLNFYTVDGTTFPFIESDSGQVATGVFVLQSTPSASAIAHPHMFIVRPLVHPHGALRKK